MPLCTRTFASEWGCRVHKGKMHKVVGGGQPSSDKRRKLKEERKDNVVLGDEVEKIVDRAKCGRGHRYQAKWVGWKTLTCEPASLMKRLAAREVEEFEKRSNSFRID
mmetsp:Transcript_15973/g.32402  ORF Transcript_15973/g.32402 Transcript_15973/m.32402 type:complete len:107 (+) Transcript_15973:422-742(+)